MHLITASSLHNAHAFVMAGLDPDLMMLAEALQFNVHTGHQGILLPQMRRTTAASVQLLWPSSFIVHIRQTARKVLASGSPSHPLQLAVQAQLPNLLHADSIAFFCNH